MYSADYYSIREVADLLGIDYHTARMRIRRGAYPAILINGKMAGVRKSTFWARSARQEAVGLIRPKNMPQVYRDERQKFLGDMSYEDCVLRGRNGT